MDGVRISAFPHEQAKSVAGHPVAFTPVRTQDREHEGRSASDWAVATASKVARMNVYRILKGQIGCLNNRLRSVAWIKLNEWIQ
jgi:hypothetical protein